MKRLALCVLASLGLAIQITPSGGSGSGFVSGIAPAILFADLATSAGRSNNKGAQYYDLKKAEEDRENTLQQINFHEQEITKLQSKIDQLNKEIKKTKVHHRKNKNTQTKIQKITEHKTTIADHQNAIKDLKNELINEM